MTLRSVEGNYRSLLLFRLASSTPHNNVEHSDPQALDARTMSDQLYVMESACPHLGADMSHADIEEAETGFVAVCPWHR